MIDAIYALYELIVFRETIAPNRRNQSTYRYDLLQDALVRVSASLGNGTNVLANPGEEAKLCPRVARRQAEECKENFGV